MTDVVDGFGGSGGAGAGLALLGLTEVGLEWERDECASRHAAGLLTVRTDVSTYPMERFAGVEGVWMSPPCPDFSLAGKGAGRTGESGWLIDQPLRWAEALRPRWLACEQVPPAEVVWREHALALQALGYHTWVGQMRAEQYGVPQTRTRAYLIAHLDHPVGPPPPTHQRYIAGQPAEEQVSIEGVLKPWVSMAEALGWGELARPSTTLTSPHDGGHSPLHGGSNSRRAREERVDAGSFVLPPGSVGFARRDDRDQSEDGYRERDIRSIDEPAFVLTEKARSWVVNTGRDWKPGEDRTTAQQRPFSEPAPAMTGQSGGAQWTMHPEGGEPWVVRTGTNSMKHSRRLEDAVQYERSVDCPSPTLESKVGSAWTVNRPSTTVTGAPGVWPPGHKVEAVDRERLGAEEADARYGARASSLAVKLEPWEALLLQGMPPWYPMQGSRTSQFRQIGNLVVPRMAAALVGEALGLDWRAACEAVYGDR